MRSVWAVNSQAHNDGPTSQVIPHHEIRSLPDLDNVLARLLPWAGSPRRSNRCWPEAAVTDAAQDSLFGADRADELPPALRRKAGQLARLPETLRQIGQARAEHPGPAAPTLTRRPPRSNVARRHGHGYPVHSGFQASPEGAWRVERTRLRP